MLWEQHKTKLYVQLLRLLSCYHSIPITTTTAHWIILLMCNIVNNHTQSNKVKIQKGVTMYFQFLSQCIKFIAPFGAHVFCNPANKHPLNNDKLKLHESGKLQMYKK